MSKPKADWPAVERDYRATNLTLRELGEKHGCSHTAIAGMAKRHEWKRDLRQAVKLATSAAVIEQVVASNANKGLQDATSVVEVVAQLNAQVISKHQAKLTKLHAAVDEALELAQGLRAEISNAKDVSAYVTAVSGVVTATKTLIEQERKAYGLDEEGVGKQESFEDMLMQAGRKPNA